VARFRARRCCPGTRIWFRACIMATLYDVPEHRQPAWEDSQVGLGVCWTTGMSLCLQPRSLALVVTGTVPGDAGVPAATHWHQSLQQHGTPSPTRARCNSLSPWAADSAVARRRLDGIKTQDGPDLKKLKFDAHRARSCAAREEQQANIEVAFIQLARCKLYETSYSAHIVLY